MISRTLHQVRTHRLFLPPASPQLNPLDGVFTNLKNRLHKKDIRGFEELQEMILWNMNQISKQPTEVYFKDVIKRIHIKDIWLISLCIFIMSVLVITLLSIIRYSQSTFTYEIPVRQVESFAFSDDLDYLVVMQGFIVNPSITTYTSLPTKLFKRKIKEYQLIGMESYKINKQQNAIFPNSVVGKISMDDLGKIFILANNDNQLRVYRSMKNTFLQTQIISIPIQNPSYYYQVPMYEPILSYKLSGDGKTILIQLSSITYVYKQNKNGFFEKFAQITSSSWKWDLTNENIYTFQNGTDKITVFTPKGGKLQSSQLTLPKTFNATQDSGTIKNFVISKHPSQRQLTVVVNVQLPSKENELRILSLNLQTNRVTYKDSIIVSQTNILFYLTKNGKYLAYADADTPKIMVYSLQNFHPSFYYKFWNFTKPSGNIFISQDGKFAATTNSQSISAVTGIIIETTQIIEPFLLFEICSIDNCFKCDLHNTKCFECDEDFILVDNSCVQNTYAKEQKQTPQPTVKQSPTQSQTNKKQSDPPAVNLNTNTKSPLDSELTTIIYQTPNEGTDQGLTDQERAKQQEQKRKQLLQKSQQQIFFQRLVQLLISIFTFCCSLTKFRKYLKRKNNDRIELNEQNLEGTVNGTEINNNVNLRQTQ